MLEKLREWLKENMPVFSQASENKYVGMVYDRFASLPPGQQKQVILGFVGFLVLMVFGYLFLSYIALWTSSGKSDRNREMSNMLIQYQRQLKEKSGQLQQLEKNDQLAGNGALKQYLADQARNAGISPKAAEAEEKPEAAGGEEGGKAGDLKVKEASITLSRVNLNQLKQFMQSVEFGNYNLSVTSLKITNDDKIRGYMKAEVGVVAYVFQAAAGE